MPKWIRLCEDYEIQLGDTVFHEHNLTVSYDHFCPNALSIWTNKVKKYDGGKLIYKEKSKSDFLMGRRPKEYYYRLWELDENGKLKRADQG